MIKIEIEFHPGSLREIVEIILSQPVELRPTHQSQGEDQAGKALGNSKRFINSLKEETPGPYLINDSCSYYFSIAGTKPIICRGEINAQSKFVKSLMMDMVPLNPIFGYACSPEERNYRNRAIVKQGVNTIESWVGRDTEKYVPGFYWLTLVPKELLKKHDVPLSAISRVALDKFETKEDYYLFQFYEEPQDWQKDLRVSELCGSLSGVFDIEKIKHQLSAAKNFLELSSLLRNWR